MKNAREGRKDGNRVLQKQDSKVANQNHTLRYEQFQKQMMELDWTKVVKNASSNTSVKIMMESLILAQNERWRRVLTMQVEREYGACPI